MWNTDFKPVYLPVGILNVNDITNFISFSSLPLSFKKVDFDTAQCIVSNKGAYVLSVITNTSISLSKCHKMYYHKI